jgi:hypothetical protein
VSLLALEVAGVRVDLLVPGPAPAALSRYRPFSGASGAADWTIELGPGPSAFSGPPGRCVVEIEDRWRVPGAEAAAWLDPAEGTGAVRADGSLLLLDTLLRAAVGTAVLARGGILVHGAALAVDGEAHLFPARSGSGKSTLAACAGHPLSDEVSVLLLGRAGFQAQATPWWTSRGGSAPLRGIWSLAWGGEATVPLPRTGLRELATNLVLPLDTPARRTAALASAAAVAASTPMGHLTFRPDCDVDALLRRARALQPGSGAAAESR